MKIVDTPLGEIRPYGRNAKKHDAKQVANVAESIRQYGFVQPIVVDGDGVIVIGHCRYAAAKKLGMDTVPVVRVEELTPEQVDALRIVDNKTNESPWDIELLMEDLPRLDLDAFDFDFALPEIKDEADEAEEDGGEHEGVADNIPPAVEDEPPEVDETDEPTCRRGDVWQLGRHRLMCGDSLSAADMQTLMGGDKADLLLTDPPYGIDYTGKTDEALKIANDSFQGGGISGISEGRVSVRGGRDARGRGMVHMACANESGHLHGGVCGGRMDGSAGACLGQELPRTWSAGLPLAARVMPVRVARWRGALLGQRQAADDGVGI